MRLRLLPRLLVFILVPCILCMFAMALLSQRQASNALNTQIEDELKMIALLQASKLDNMFSTFFAVGYEYSTKPLWKQLLASAPDSPGYAAIVEEAKSNLIYLRDTFDAIVSAGVTDTQGIVKSHTMDATVGANFW